MNRQSRKVSHETTKLFGFVNDDQLGQRDDRETQSFLEKLVGSVKSHFSSRRTLEQRSKGMYKLFDEQLLSGEQPIFT